MCNISLRWRSLLSMVSNEKSWFPSEDSIAELRWIPPYDIWGSIDEDQSICISEYHIELNKKRIADGTHNWLSTNGGSERAKQQQLERIYRGTHTFLGSDFNSSKFSREIVSQLKKLTRYQRKLLGLTSGWYKMPEQDLHSVLLEYASNPSKYPCNLDKTKVNKIAHAKAGKNRSSTMKSAEWKLFAHKTCPHCNKTCDPGNYSRYHGNKCKNILQPIKSVI